MAEDHTHIVSSFDEELTRLNNIISQMGGLAESQLISSIRSIVKRDSELAEKVISRRSRLFAFIDYPEVPDTRSVCDGLIRE